MSPSISSTEKKSRGRPRTNPVAQHFTMSQELSASVDAWIMGHRDPKPTRPEAIRRLIEAGLGKTKASPPSGGTGSGTAKKPATAGKTAAPTPRKAGQKHQTENSSVRSPTTKEAQL